MGLGRKTNPPKDWTLQARQPRQNPRNRTPSGLASRSHTLTHLCSSFYQGMNQFRSCNPRAENLGKRIEQGKTDLRMPRSKPRPGANVDKYMLRTEELRKNQEHVCKLTSNWALLNSNSLCLCRWDSRRSDFQPFMPPPGLFSLQSSHF